MKSAAGHTVAALAALALLVPAAVSAQTAEPPPEVREWIMEIQQIQAQLEPVQAQALEDEALLEEQREVSAAVRDAMVAADPQVQANLERLQAIMREAQQAQQTSDAEKIVALTAEAEQIQARLAEAQQEAMGQPEVEARVEAFQHKLHARMVQINPESRALLDRLQELDERVRAAIDGVA